MRAAGERFSEGMLGGLFLRVQELRVGREIARLRARMGAGEPGVDENRLTELEATLHTIRQAIRTLPVDE